MLSLLLERLFVGDCDGELTGGVGVGVEGEGDEVKHAALSVCREVGDEVDSIITFRILNSKIPHALYVCIVVVSSLFE